MNPSHFKNPGFKGPILQKIHNLKVKVCDDNLNSDKFYHTFFLIKHVY